MRNLCRECADVVGFHIALHVQQYHHLKIRYHTTALWGLRLLSCHTARFAVCQSKALHARYRVVAGKPGLWVQKGAC